MDHVITIGDILKASGAVIAAIGVIGFLLYLLAAFGRGMSR